MSKTAAPTSVPTGGTLTYTVVVRANAANFPGGGVMFDTFQSGVSFLQVVNTSPGVNCSGLTEPNGQTVVTCILPSMAANQTVTMTYSVIVTAPNNTSVCNTARVFPTPRGGIDSNPQNDQQTLCTNVGGFDATIAKTANPSPVNAGQALTYTVTVSGVNGATGGTITVTDNVPTSLTGVTAAGSGWTCNVGAGNVVTCSRTDSVTAPAGYPPITISGTVNACVASISNTATLSTSDSNSANNSATVTTPVNCGALGITKTGANNQNVVNIGNPQTWNIVVSNTQGVTTGPVTVTDTVPANFTNVAAQGPGWNCNVAGNTVTCTRNDQIPAGNSYPTLVVTATASNPSVCGPVTNTATATGGGTPNPVSASHTTTVNCVGLTVTKDDSADPAGIGQTETWTILVNNAGPGATNGTITVTDTVPGPFGNVAVASAPGWNCNVAGNTVTCSRSDSLSVGSYPAIQITASASNCTASPVTNTVSVSGGGLAAPITASEQTAIACPNLTITKSGNPSTVLVGQQVTYTLVVNNSTSTTNGPIQVTDNVPNNFTNVAASGTGWACNVAGNQVSCFRATPLSGNADPITITATASQAGTVTNTATVSGGGDTTPASDSETTTITGVSASFGGANGIVKAQTATTLNLGETQNYTITVTNTGTSATVGTITVNDAVPANYTVTGATGTGWSCAITGNAVGCTRTGSLGSGETSPAITITATAATCGTGISNTATVSGGGTAGSAQSTAVTSTITCPNAAFGPSTKTDALDPVQLGQTQIWTITVRNDAGGTTTNGLVTVTDTVPGQYDMVTASGPGWTCAAPVGNTVTCTRSDALQAGQAYPAITVQARAITCAPGTVDNTATISGGGGGNDVTVTQSTAIPCPAWTLAKTGPATVGVNQQVVWNISATNSGTGRSFGTVTIGDSIPTNYSNVVAQGNGWNCNVAGALQVTCTRSDSLPAGGVYPPVTIQATATTCAPGPIDNIATVDGGGALASANATFATAITCPMVTLTGTKVANAASVDLNGQVTWTVTAGTTAGSSPTSASVQVTDTIPGQFEVVSATGQGWVCQTPANVVTCTRGDTLAGGSNFPSITIVARAVQCSPAPFVNIVNTATISGGGATASFDAASAPVTVPCPLLTIDKTDATDPIAVGATETWTISVSNTAGNGATFGTVTVTDVVPANFTAVTAGGLGWTCNVAGQTVTCTRTDSLAPGASYGDITISGVATTCSTVAVTNTAQVSGGGQPGNVSIGADTTITCPNVVLAVTKATVAPATIFIGDTATWNITVGNTGTTPTNGAVTVTDVVPAQFGTITAAGSGWTCLPVVGQNVSCSRSDVLANGNNFPPITITAVANQCAGAPITNTATASGGSAPVSGSGASTITVTCPANTNTFTLIKDDALDTLTAGQTQTWTLTVGANAANTTPTAGAVTLADTIPLAYGNVTVTSAPGWSCSVTGNTVSCINSAPLQPGTNYSPVTITAVSNSTACDGVLPVVTVVNQASVSGGGATGTSTQETTDITCPDPAFPPSLTIDKIGNLMAVTVGQAQTWAINVANFGFGPTAGTVTVTDQVPAEFGNITSATGNGWTCTITGQTVVCTTATPLAAGDAYPTITIAATATACPAVPGAVTNTATVSGGGSPNALDTHDTTLNCTASSLGIFKDGSFDTATPITPGQAQEFYIFIDVNAGSTFGTITVTDTVPIGFDTVSVLNATGWTCSVTGNVVTCSRSDSFSAGAAIPQITIRAVATSAACAGGATVDVVNTATVTGGGDPATPLNSAHTTTIICPAPTFAITKAPNQGTVNLGDPVSYVINVSNTGAGPSVGTVTVTDTVPANITGVTGSGTGWSCMTAGQTVTCTRSDILPAASAYPALTVAGTASAPGTTANTATVSGGGSGASATSLAANVTVTTPALAINKVATQASVNQGATQTWEITVSNPGGGAGPTSGQITLQDAVPSNFNMVTAAGGAGWNCTVAGNNVTCTTNSVVTPGSSLPNVTISAVAVTCGPTPVINNATVSGGNTAAAQTDADAGTTIPCANPTLGIEKSASDPTLESGQTQNWTIVVSNGPAAATATSGTVTVTDTIPAQYDTVSATGTGWNCNTSSNSVTCSRSDALGINSSYPPISITAVARTCSGAPIANSATVSGGGNAMNVIDDDGGVTIGCPVLSIAKTALGPTTVARDTDVTWTIAVSNTGAAATNGSVVTVGDTVPSVFTNVAVNGAGWSCVLQAGGNALTCTRSDAIPAGASYPPLTVTATATTCGQSPNTATVSGGGAAPANDDDGAGFLIICPNPIWDLTKSPSDATLDLGATQSWTISVANDPAPLDPASTQSFGTVTVVDTLPANYGGTITATGTGWTCNVAAQTVTCTRTDSLDRGTTYPPITVSATAIQCSAVAVVNTAVVSGGGAATSDGGSDSVTINCPTFSVTKARSDGGLNSADIGQTVAWTVTVTNTGTGPTLGTVTLTDSVPASYTNVSASGTGWTCNVAGNNISCTRSNVLEDGQAYPPLTISATATTCAAATVTNTVSVGGGGVLTPASATDLGITIGCPAFSITKSDGVDPIGLGDTQTYTIDVDNTGGGATSGTITVADSVPSAYTNVQAGGPGWNCVVTGNDVTCTRSDVFAAGADLPDITITGVANVCGADPVSNTATVSGGGAQASASSTAQTTNIPCPDLAIDKVTTTPVPNAGPGTYNIGQPITFTVTVSNTAIAAANTFGTVTVTDTLPNLFAAISATGTGWTCSVGGNTVTCTRSDELLGGAAYPAITIVATPQSCSSPNPVTNTATVTGGGDPTLPASDSVDLTVGCPNLTLSKTDSPDPIDLGATMMWTLIVGNGDGADGATSGPVTVIDTIPSQFTPINASGTGWTCTLNGNNLTCTRSNPLAPGSVYPAIIVTATATTCTSPMTTTNTATASGGADPTSATVSQVSTVNCPNLALNIDDTVDPLPPIDTETFIVTVSNIGDGPTLGTVTVSTTLPEPFVGITASGTGWTCTVAGQLVTCERNNALDDGSSYPAITITATNGTLAGGSKCAGSTITQISVSGGGDATPGSDQEETTFAPGPGRC